ncbi:MAG: hypothetical protein E8D41_14875 [Nitrospira sp.]|nr:MAG: hypothetical protein E8D41_14875 [Nitrospira sp.]
MIDVTRQSDVAHRILAVLTDQSGLLLEELLDRCPDATWNQVFAVVDHLSRIGEIRLTAKGMGKYHVALSVVQQHPKIHQ